MLEKLQIIEISGTSGSLPFQTERNPFLYTTTYGVGEVIRDAIARGWHDIFFSGMAEVPQTMEESVMLQALGFDLLDHKGFRYVIVLWA